MSVYDFVSFMFSQRAVLGLNLSEEKNDGCGEAGPDFLRISCVYGVEKHDPPNRFAHTSSTEPDSITRTTAIRPQRVYLSFTTQNRY